MESHSFWVASLTTLDSYQTVSHHSKPNLHIRWTGNNWTLKDFLKQKYQLPLSYYSFNIRSIFCSNNGRRRINLKANMNQSFPWITKNWLWQGLICTFNLFSHNCWFNPQSIIKFQHQKHPIPHLNLVLCPYYLLKKKAIQNWLAPHMIPATISILFLMLT